MRSFVLAVSLASIAVAFAGCAGKEATPPAETKYAAYANAAHAFRMDYPETWTKTEKVEGSTVVEFKAPTQGFQEGLAVGVVNWEGTLDQFVDGLVANQEKGVENYKLVHNTNATLAGVPARDYQYTGGPSTFTVVSTQIVTLKDGKIFLLTYSQPKGAEANTQPLIDRMVQSFAFA